MAGSRKGKNKKKKEKAIPHKSSANNKQIEISNFNPRLLHEKEGDRYDAKCIEDNEVERQLYFKIEEAFKEASNTILGLGYNSQTTAKALLSAGFIVGESNIQSSIIKNSLSLINSCCQIDGEVMFDKEPIFETMPELIRFWVQTLVNLVRTKWSVLLKSDALMRILSSKSLAIERSHQGYTHNKGETLSSAEKGDEFNFDTLLCENIDALKNMNLTRTPKVTSQMEMNDTSFVNSQEYHQSYMQSPQHSSKGFEFDKSLSSPKYFVKCIDEAILKEWLRNSSGKEKDELILTLEDQIGILEQQADDRKEWAKKKVREAIAKLRTDTHELNILRLEKEEKEQTTKEKEELATSWTTKILDKEIDRRKENHQFAYIYEQVKKIEAENVEIQANLTAVELNESESKRNLKQILKKERVDLKKIENSKKHIRKTRVQINEENGMSLQVQQELKNIEAAQKEAKLKYKQELEEKEQARILVLEEKTLTRIARENASTRLSSLQQELEMEHKLVMDRKARLMQQLSDLKISSAHLLDYGISKGESSQNFIEKIPDHRRCTICFQNEVSILFIPCAHQVVCFDCSGSMGDSCPSCQVQIAKKYVVYN